MAIVQGGEAWEEGGDVRLVTINREKHLCSDHERHTTDERGAPARALMGSIVGELAADGLAQERGGGQRLDALPPNLVVLQIP